MTAGLLNTEGFQNFKYCIRSKGLILQFMISPRLVKWQATDTSGVR